MRVEVFWPAIRGWPSRRYSAERCKRLCPLLRRGSGKPDDQSTRARATRRQAPCSRCGLKCFGPRSEVGHRGGIAPRDARGCALCCAAGQGSRTTSPPARERSASMRKPSLINTFGPQNYVEWSSRPRTNWSGRRFQHFFTRHRISSCSIRCACGPCRFSSPRRAT